MLRKPFVILPSGVLIAALVLTFQLVWDDGAVNSDSGLLNMQPTKLTNDIKQKIKFKNNEIDISEVEGDWDMACIGSLNEGGHPAVYFRKLSRPRKTGLEKQIWMILMER